MKKKETKKETKKEVEEVVKSPITPLTQEFGNGDLNTLRDKINELVANS